MKQSELSEILSTATSLKIRGLMTAEVPDFFLLTLFFLMTLFFLLTPFFFIDPVFCIDPFFY